MTSPTVREDGSPGDLLALLLGRLRERPSELCVDTGDALRVDTDRFARSLARHLQDSKESLFLNLRLGEPASASALEELEEEHQVLHRHTRDLATKIRRGDRERAYEAGRACLAVLLDHLRREARTGR